MNMVQQQSGLHFSVSQWQDFELHALIFRHIVNGAAVPPELLHLLNKSITLSSNDSSSSLYYVANPFQYFPHYQSALMQSVYWGKAAMDPEPGRCRRTDGKKWRCSRDVVAGHKYCERHVHRGKNRSRKHVETPPTALFDNAAGEDDDRKTVDSGEGSGGGTPQFRNMNLSQLQQRAAADTKCPFQVLNDSGGRDRTLRPFFDDWPRSANEANDGSRSLTTNLSISVAGNSDFSLKLGTGNEDQPRSQAATVAREKNWIATWEMANSTLGGPLAEALRSSNSNPYSASGAT